MKPKIGDQIFFVGSGSYGKIKKDLIVHKVGNKYIYCHEKDTNYSGYQVYRLEYHTDRGFSIGFSTQSTPYNGDFYLTDNDYNDSLEWENICYTYFKGISRSSLSVDKLKQIIKIVKGE